MIVDTSAVMAILLDEAEAETFTRLIIRAAAPRMAAPSVLEAMIVAVGRFGPEGRHRVVELLGVLEIDIVPFDSGLVDLAIDAFLRFGKGRHPASLNFGDCLSYALARREAAPLLFKGADFAQTDIAAVV